MEIYLRNIPTFVGNSLNLMMLLGTAIASSPHLWGKLIKSIYIIQSNRNIPTLVGKMAKGML